MTKPGLLAIAMVSIIIFLFATKPSRDEFDKELTSMMREKLTSPDFNKEKDVSFNLAVLGCKLKPEECLSLIRRAYVVSTYDYFVVTRHVVSGPGASISCFGLLRQFVCDGMVSLPTARNIADKLKSIFGGYIYLNKPTSESPTQNFVKDCRAFAA
jgi:hypothetical protein